MATYGDMQSRIANELLGRSDLVTEIQNAIQDAIKDYERQRFWFNELNGVDLFNTVAGQEFYTSIDSAYIASIAELDVVRILVYQNRYPLNRRDWQFMERVSISTTSRGLPVDFAYYAESIRLYPIPDRAYPISLFGTQRLATLADDGDSNAWTNEAERLIRNAAKRIIQTEVLYDPENAALAERAEAQALASLNAETQRRLGTGRIRPTTF